MSFDADKLYELLPAVHRVRDAELGYPLKQLIGVIAGQVAVVQENLDQLYDNNFVETAAPWVLSYIGDLLGIRGLSGSTTLTRTPRAEVGHTIAYRRRKGTAAMLELLAHDVTGWPARAVEYFERLATTQHVNHVRLQNRAFTSLHSADELEFFATPFESATRTVEVRRIEPARGKWNIPNVGLFLWRLGAYKLTRTPLVLAQSPLADDRHFRFHPLGLDLPLFSLPETEDEFTHLAEPLNVPMPISRRMLKGSPAQRTVAYKFSASTSPPTTNDGTLQLDNSDPTKATHLYVAKQDRDLSDVNSRLGCFSVDDLITLLNETAGGASVLYRITAITIQTDFFDFTIAYESGGGVFSSEDKATLSEDTPTQFHPSADYYGTAASIRLEKQVAGEFDDILATEVLVADLSDTQDSGGNPMWAHQDFGESENLVLLDPQLGRVLFPAAQTEPVYATFYYGFSMDLGGGEYDRSGTFDTTAGSVVEVANTNASKLATVEAGLAALGLGSGVVEIMDSSRYEEVFTSIDATSRQVEIRAGDGCRPTIILELTNPLTISGNANGVVTLNGLLLCGPAIASLGIGHFIQIPGDSELGKLRLRHCTILPLDTDGSVTLDGTTTAITIESATTVVEIEDCILGPIRVGPDITVQMKNCIVDAGSTTNVALVGLDDSSPAGSWTIENCTIRGKVSVSVLELASNTIFLGDLFVQRRQEGCVRFSWLPDGARVPRQYECLPSEEEPDVHPVFTSFHYGDAAYGQLSRFCPASILSGADDESEIGAFHDLYQPQRDAYLAARLVEYLRFGLEAGIFHQT